MEISTSASSTIVIFLLLALLFVLFKLKTKPGPCSQYSNLPPGSFGWPIVGETLDLLRANRTGNPEKFIRDRITKYNSNVFKTSILGDRMIVLCGPAGNKFLFSNESKKVELWWPSSVRKSIGTSLLTKVGDEGKSEKKTLMAFFSPEVLMRYVGTMDEVTQHHLRTRWEGKDQVEAYPNLKLYTFELACRLFMNLTDQELIARLAPHFNVFVKGVLDLPLNFPGTRFSRAMKAADSIRKEFHELLKQRRVELAKANRVGSSMSQDMLSFLLVNGDEKGKLMSELEIMNNLLNILFAGHDTTTSTLMLIVKYLGELPHVLHNVLAEQREIAASKASGELLQWSDIQKMKYSWNVICEVMRMTPPILGTFRETLVDCTFGGYTIPKGWKLHWTAAITHKDPNYHPKATSFDASRFEGSGPAPYSYVPFGGGPRMCLGNEFARVEMLVFLHNLVTRFHWELAIPDEKIVYDSMPVPERGLLLRLRPRRFTP